MVKSPAEQTYEIVTFSASALVIENPTESLKPIVDFVSEENPGHSCVHIHPPRMHILTRSPGSMQALRLWRRSPSSGESWVRRPLVLILSVHR